jgi:FKBP-type peptidyl-prolyl cis-trans isomerase
MNRILPCSLVPALLASVLHAQIPECEAMKTTPSGLQYGVLQAGGEGARPKSSDMVKVHYTGWLTDGKKFDSSRDRGEPAQFPLDGVIKGWTEGVQLMTPGARFKFVIPPELGYGAMAQGDRIPANSTLVFEVELLEVIVMPVFPVSDPEKQSELPSGVKWETVKEGTGEVAGKPEAVAFSYAIFSPEGRLLDCSQRRNNNLIGGTRETLPFPFLKDLVDRMKPGGQVRLEVTAAAVPSMRQDTVWLLELVGVHTVPEFRALDPEKTKTTESGLKYEVLREGDGAAPGPTSMVSALYTGWLTDGTMFDSAHARGMATEFGLNMVIKGWTEGLQLMKVGGACLFEIPSDLGYGPNGSPPRIPGGATLVFLVELQGVK